MIKLLKANFYKLSKEKSFYILMALSVVISLSTVLISYIFGNAAEVSFGADAAETVRNSIRADAMFLSGASLGQNLGILLVLGITLFIGKEFSQNTIRNKITIGYSKQKIYLSNFIMSLAISMLLYCVYQFVVFCIALPMFGWSNNGFIFSEFIRQLINSLSIIIAFSATLNLISMFSRNMVAGIMISMLVIMFGVLIFAGIQAIPLEGGTKTFVDILVKSNFMGQSTIISSTNTVSFMLWCVVSAIIVTVITTVLGSFLFEKTDIK